MACLPTAAVTAEQLQKSLQPRILRILRVWNILGRWPTSPTTSPPEQTPGHQCGFKCSDQCSDGDILVPIQMSETFVSQTSFWLGLTGNTAKLLASALPLAPNRHPVAGKVHRSIGAQFIPSSDMEGLYL